MRPTNLLQRERVSHGAGSPIKTTSSRWTPSRPRPSRTGRPSSSASTTRTRTRRPTCRAKARRRALARRARPWRLHVSCVMNSLFPPVHPLRCNPGSLMQGLDNYRMPPSRGRRRSPACRQAPRARPLRPAPRVFPIRQRAFPSKPPSTTGAINRASVYSARVSPRARYAAGRSHVAVSVSRCQ